MLCLLVVAWTGVQSQPPRRPPGVSDADKKRLAEPFKGVTTNGKVVPDLFSIQATGISTEPVKMLTAL